MDERKAELLQTMAAVELTPEQANAALSAQPYEKVSLSRLAALGVGLEPVVGAVQQVLSHGQAVSGIYKVTIPAGTHLAKFKGSADFLGTALSNANNAIQSQAHLQPLLCNPTMLFMAAALAGIDKKLDFIHEMQREMLDFLVQKEKSELKGDLDFLSDVFYHYKFNWDDEKYKSANHIKALDIRQRSGQRVDFYKEQLKKCLNKRGKFHSDQEVSKQLGQAIDLFGDYQASLYLYGFSSFVEILLQENFTSAYLDAVAQKLDALSLDYRELYSAAYTRLKEQADSSLQRKMLQGLSSVTKAAGETIAKLPVIGKSQLDETLLSAGESMVGHGNDRLQAALLRLAGYQSGQVRPFIEQIQRINQLYNQPMTVFFDCEALYLYAGQAEEPVGTEGG